MLLPAETLLLNRYFIVRFIGYSGTTVLYDAKDQTTNQSVILKQNLIPNRSLQKDSARQIGQLTRFMRFSAQNGFTNEQGEFTVIRDPLSDDLETLLQWQNIPFAFDQVVEWANQLLHTLEYLHSRSHPIIHGHITPSTLKLSPENEIILLDSPTTYLPNEVKRDLRGKLNPYASPEQWNDLEIDHSTDLYSLGGTLLYLLTLKEPPTGLVRMYALTHELPDPLDPFDLLDQKIPFEMINILNTSLHLSPIERQSSARVMGKALNWVLPKISERVRPTPQPDKSALRPNQSLAYQRKRVRLKAVNLFLVACLFLLMITLLNISSPFTVHGDTLSPTPIRLTIPTPKVEPTAPTSIEMVPK